MIRSKRLAQKILRDLKKAEAEIERLEELLALGWEMHEDEWECRDSMSEDYRRWITEVKKLAADLKGGER